MPINPSNVPYPGKDHGCYGQNGLLKMKDISDKTEKELITLMTSCDDSMLKRAYSGVCNAMDDKGSALQYDGCELWLYNDWHENEDKDHATFRLFENCDTPATSTPWNGRTYHLYRDGTSRAFTHNKPESK